MNLELSGQRVDAISFDYAVTLGLEGGVDIRLETAFSLRIPSGQTVVIDPEHVGAGVEHILCVLHETITDAVTQDNGTLMLAFGNDARLDVSPDESYEAWTLAGPRGWKVVVAPGGGLSVWDPQI